MIRRDPRTSSNEAAWDIVADKYEPDIESDAELIRTGGTTLTEVELRILGDLAGCARAIHLQCSHGSDALSLLNLGASEVIGLDLSAAMLALATAKSERLGARATWIHAEVLDPPSELFGTADLVYTGKGALIWVADIGRWARVVSKLLKPGGRFFVHEAHPLNGMWDESAENHVLMPGRRYFDVGPRPNTGFPSTAVERHAPVGREVPVAWEYQWTLGAIVTSLAEAGLEIHVFEEHGEVWWPQFPQMPPEEMDRLPHMFSLLAVAK